MQFTVFCSSHFEGFRDSFLCNSKTGNYHGKTAAVTVVFRVRKSLLFSYNRYRNIHLVLAQIFFRFMRYVDYDISCGIIYFTGLEYKFLNFLTI
jgi:hypothetical protein